MRYLRGRVTAVTLDLWPLARGLLAGWRFRVQRRGEGRCRTAQGWAAPGSEGLVLVPYWGLPR